MNESYKVVIYNRRICRDIVLADNSREITVGTNKQCSVRFSRDSFFDDFEFSIKSIKGVWQIRCSDGVFISDANSMKYSSKGLNQGDTYSIKYQSSGQEIFKLLFTANFDDDMYNYSHYISLDGCSKVSLGSDESSDIVLNNSLLTGMCAVLSKDGGDWSVTDVGSKFGILVNGRRITKTGQLRNYDFFSILGYSFFFKDEKLYFDPTKGISSAKLVTEPIERISSCLEYPKFNRNTRLKYVLSDEPIEILDPEQKPEKPKNNLLMSLLPAIGSIALVLVLRGGMLSGKSSFLANLSQNSYILFSVASMGLGIITSILSLISGKKDYRENTRKRENVYLKYIERKGKAIDEIRDQERDLLNDTYYSPEEELKQVHSFSGDLFDRTINDEDFLHVRLGMGSRPAKRLINYKKQERLHSDDTLMSKPEDLYNEFKNIENVPVIIKLGEANSIGVIGTSDSLYQIMKNMIIDICIRHYHKDVKLFFILSDENAQKLYWARWFQNVQNDQLNVRNIVCDAESKNNLFEYLYVELSQREAEKQNYPRVVVIVFDDVGIKLHPLSKYLDKAKDLGFTFVFFEEYKELLPQGCESIVALNPDGITGRIIPTADVNSACDFEYTTISDEDAAYIAQRMAPVYCEEVGLESDLTKNITLFDLLHIMTPHDLDLTARWRESEVYKSMSAPLGVKRKNEVVSLDLHEKAHGPHGLVAGTTGSGKSEILQSYILSMATLFHPYEVSFVIIDFKGGGMVNQFKNLPHLIGAITNIDGDEIERSLLSIRAELLKRQNLFAGANVNHIDAYIKKFKNGEVDTPLPHLIIVVDEFAELKAEQPEFMKELISAARIGRSLGVHLILATQKPAGQVSEQIWSNSRFKLCLKVQEKSDSNEVLKSPLAAEIKEPGRAYLQVGNNEIFDLFQSAYSGAPASVNDSNAKEYKIYSVSFSGKRAVLFEQKKQKGDAAAQTQLNAIVTYVDEYCNENGIEKLPNICLPSLPEIIDWENVPVYDDDFVNSVVPVGLYDDPSHQLQGDYSIDLAEENVMIVGSSRFGKTNILQLFIRSLASRFSPDEINIYILDFASMVLKNFESLAHVGGVVTAADDEKLINFFKLINSEIVQRKKLLVKAGVSSFSAYREAGYTDMPQIVIMVDNLTALKEMYFQDDDPLLAITREGISVGITCVIANSSTSGIGYRYLSNFSSRIALYCNDSTEYSSVFDSCRKRPKAIAGRALIMHNKELFSCQTYRAFSGEKEIDRVAQMREFVEETNEVFDGMQAKIIPEIPTVLTASAFEKNYSYLANQKGSVMIGLDYSSVEPVLLDCLSLGALGIIGRKSSGKGNFVQYLINSLSHKSSIKLYVADDVNRKFAIYKDKCEKYAVNTSVITDTLREWDEILTHRYELLEAENNAALQKEPFLVFVMQHEDAHKVISDDAATLAIYKKIVGKFKALRVCILFSNLPNEAITYSSPEVLKIMRDNRNNLFFDDISNLKAFEIPYAVQKQFKKPIEKGDGYLLIGNDVAKIKTPLID